MMMMMTTNIGNKLLLWAETQVLNCQMSLKTTGRTKHYYWKTLVLSEKVYVLVNSCQHGALHCYQGDIFQKHCLNDRLKGPPIFEITKEQRETSWRFTLRAASVLGQSSNPWQTIEASLLSRSAILSLNWL